MIPKIAKYILGATLFLAVAGCANIDQTPAEAFKDTPQEEIFKGGQLAMEKGKYSAAIKHYEAIESLYPFGKVAEQSQLDIIYAYYEIEDNASALAAADRYIRLYPRNKNVDYAYYIKGVINMDRAQSWIQKIARINPADRELEPMQEAFNSFNQLVRYFPKSQYAPDALKRMIYIRQLIAQKELDIAKYYLKRKLYVASANRSSYVFKHFQGTPQSIEAIGVMVHAYRELGQNKMADDAAKILKMNFPDSETYQQLKA